MNPFFVTDFSISDSLKTVRKSVLIYETIILWGLNVKTDVESKKVRPTEREMTTPLFLLRCVQLGLSMADLDMLSIGLINDMYAESRNGDCKYAELATQEDFDKF